MDYHDAEAGLMIAQGTKTLGTRQTAFDAELTAIEEALRWYETTQYHHMIIHSNSTSTITRTGQSGAGHARKIQQMVACLLHQNQTAKITLVKGYVNPPKSLTNARHGNATILATRLDI
jgi:hypothetical protein